MEKEQYGTDCGLIGLSDECSESLAIMGFPFAEQVLCWR
jgi:hypothetical protein